MFEAELLVHLDTQIGSARKLLGLVLEQGKSIRNRDVDGVLGRLADIQAEMGRRGQLETERVHLLRSAGAALGMAPTDVTVEHLCHLVDPGAAENARHRSMELRGLLAEIAREHGINRALMRQELAFLSHLTRLVGQEPEGAYAAPGTSKNGDKPAATSSTSRRVLDLQA